MNKITESNINELLVRWFPDNEQISATKEELYDFIEHLVNTNLLIERLEYLLNENTRLKNENTYLTERLIKEPSKEVAQLQLENAELQEKLDKVISAIKGDYEFDGDREYGYRE
jgi:regulator of replication initiation timing